VYVDIRVVVGPPSEFRTVVRYPLVPELWSLFLQIIFLVGGCDWRDSMHSSVPLVFDFLWPLWPPKQAAAPQL